MDVMFTLGIYYLASYLINCSNCRFDHFTIEDFPVKQWGRENDRNGISPNSILASG